MALLHLDALPHRTSKGTLVRLLVQVAGIDRKKIGAIQVRGRGASIELPDALLAKAVAKLDGTRLANQNIRAWSEQAASRGDEEDHFERFRRLLLMESEAEAEQMLAANEGLADEDAERTGTCLLGLVLRDATTGLGERVLALLSRRNPQAPLGWTRLNAGSPVRLSEYDSQGKAKPQSWRGVVSQRTGTSIEVALERYPEDDDALYRLDLSPDEIGRQRQLQALARAQSASHDRLSELRDVLLLQRKPRFTDDSPTTPRSATLNASQHEAIELAMSAEDIAIIHGPPGTGKTTTVAELIRQSVQQEQKVLACAPSNLAVDNIFERLLAGGINAVRLGHPARVLPALRDHTLDLMVQAHPDAKLARKLIREAGSMRDKADRFTRARPAPGAKRAMREEAKQLISDARRIQAQLVEQILDQADVLCATTTSLDSEVLGQRTFDLAVVDEACQCVEPNCWIPLLRSQRLVLAGDHFQLPPTVVSRAAERQGLGISMLERLVGHLGTKISRRLDTQYRMHEAIMRFSSREFYDDELRADGTVAGHRLSDLPEVTADFWTEEPLLFVDTAGAGYDEQLEPDGESRRNPQEATWVLRAVARLQELGVADPQIAVITPYAAQVRLLREQRPSSDVEIDSVDGFQGREKEAVIISLVRSNVENQIGFLADTRRMNVALTRARRKLIVIGDSATIGSHPFYTRLLEYFEQQQAYHTVWEELV